MTNGKIPRTGIEAAKTAARIVELRKRATELAKNLKCASPATLAEARQFYEVMGNPTADIMAALRIIKESERKA